MKTSQIIDLADAVVEDFSETNESARTTDFDGDITYNRSFFKDFTSFYGRMVALSDLIEHDVARVSFLENETSVMFAIASAMREFFGSYHVWKARQRLHGDLEENQVRLGQQEVEEIESLISQMRTALRTSQWLDEKHKQRLLARLEALQREIHKVQSDFDVALAGLVETGAVIGEFGEKAQPFADFMERIVGVFNKKKEDPLQLPAPPKKLPPPS